VKHVFVDGAAGTTGLTLLELLAPMEARGELRLVPIEHRRDPAQRLRAHAAADLGILCLPDDAARETMALLDGRGGRVLDASSAHRTTEGWTYGFAELTADQPARIATAQRVSNPGCYATAALALIRPLRDAELVAADQLLTIVGVSGYTGGGSRLIARHQAGGADFALANVLGAYSLGARHKHVAEIQRYGRLDVEPVFLPHVVNVPRGLMVSIVLRDLDVAAVQEAYQRAYLRDGSKVRIVPRVDGLKRLDFGRFVALNQPNSVAPPQDDVELHVTGWDQDGARQVTVHALLDNLGKGAATQAIQNLRLMLGMSP